jgi:hypothetical protein
LNAFEEVAFYVIKNFEVPSTHKEYIIRSLGISDVDGSLNMIDEIVKNHKKITEHFNIEVPLRAIEAYFSWNEPEIELEKLKVLKYLIAKLHSLIGDRKI